MKLLSRAPPALLAMQKVEGSNPFSRLGSACKSTAFSAAWSANRAESRTPSRSDPRLHCRPLASGVTRVGSALGLDQEDVRLFCGLGAVLDAARHDIEVAGPELDVTITQLDRQMARKHQEEVVGVRVCVPYELAFGFDDLDLVVVQLGDELWTEVLAEAGELCREIHFFCHRISLSRSGSGWSHASLNLSAVWRPGSTRVVIISR